jgi:hypothetical protein
MPNLEGVTPGGYDDAAASSLEQGMTADAEGALFYQQFPNSKYANQYDPVEYDEIEGNPEEPAQLTDVPTSSTNVRRPRTVAAGYDEQRKVLTVMFRDGTLFNYYDVDPGTWKTFHNSYSKGPMLNLYNKGTYSPGALLMSPHTYGPADVSNVSPEVLSTIYRVARASQFRYASNKGTVYRTAQGKGFSAPKSKGGRAPKNSPPAAKAHRPHKP